MVSDMWYLLLWTVVVLFVSGLAVFCTWKRRMTVKKAPQIDMRWRFNSDAAYSISKNGVVYHFLKVLRYTKNGEENKECFSKSGDYRWYWVHTGLQVDDSSFTSEQAKDSYDASIRAQAIQEVKKHHQKVELAKEIKPRKKDMSN